MIPIPTEKVLLRVIVMAPTEDLWISNGTEAREAGDLFVTDVATLAEMWYIGIDVVETGGWRVYHPDGTWHRVDKKGVRIDDKA